MSLFTLHVIFYITLHGVFFFLFRMVSLVEQKLHTSLIYQSILHTQSHLHNHNTTVLAT